MHNVYLFQPQYTTTINGQTNNWLPYSAGAIWSYAAQYQDVTDNFQFKDIIFRREEISSLLDRLDNPKVCGFSCYLWNRNYCLEVAKQIKQRWPDCVIVFGGPEVSAKMIKHSFISSIILGEGEENFVDILRNVQNGVNPSLFSPKNRLASLTIPSPYLTGVFDKIIDENPEVMWAITIETNRGCPYACTFCDWGSLTYSKVKRFELDKVAAEIAWTVGKPISYIYIADANFGMFKERDLEIARLLKAATDNSNVDLISVQNAKQSTEIAFKIGQILGEKYAGVSIAMQSMNEDTLDAINRKNLSTNNTRELLELSAKYQIPTYTEMILGMPNETVESWCKGMTELLELGQHNSIEMWFTQLLENSELSQPNSRFQYKIKSVISKNYISLKKPTDWIDVDEETELISATSTMSTDEMVEAYMYGWMIVQIHIAGYSQVISRYQRFAKDISYYDFYNKLIANIKTSDFFGAHYDYVHGLVKSFLHTGIVEDEATGHMLHSVSGPWLYENRKQVIDFIGAVSEVPDWVLDLQHSFIYDQAQTYPVTIQGDVDIFAATTDQTIYTVTSRLTDTTKPLNSATMRRKGLLKNIIKGAHYENN
jgi:radical SAM superfamily enzyme YgiQ (UPF0313 family)